MQRKWTYTLATAAAGVGTVAAGFLGSGALAATVYSDVPPSHWAYNSVQWTSQYGIMVGPGGRPGFFDIAGLVNRAQLATVIARYNDMVQKDLIDLKNRVQLLEQKVRTLEGTKTSSSSSRSSTITSGFFSASLTPGQETQTVVSSGVGNGSFALNGNVLNYDITVSNLTTSMTAAHFHMGAPGVAGPVVEPIAFNGNRAQGTWTLTDTERADLLAGRIYVNVHTTRYPDGELRGQILFGQSSSMSSMSSLWSSSSSSVSSMSASSLSSASSVSSGASSSASS